MTHIMTEWLKEEEIKNLLGGHKPARKILMSIQTAETFAHLEPGNQKQIADFLINLKTKIENSPPSKKNVRPRSKLFRALGEQEPPNEVQINRQSYRLQEIYKHDSWAATAIYEGKSGKIVCKFNRQQSIFGIPMGWLGRRLAHRENKFLQMFADLPNIPSYCGEVVAYEEILPYASAHIYVEGTPLRRYPHKVSDDFFPQLQNVLKIIHTHQISYMDLNKQENILVTEDGKPCLIDFQICFHLSHRWPGNSAPMRFLLQLLQRSDDYHLMKHFTRLRPDLFTPSELQQAQKRPWFLNLYRCFQIPLRTLRRRLLTALGFRNRSGKVNSETFVEHGIRKFSNDIKSINFGQYRLSLKNHASSDAIEIVSLNFTPIQY